MCRINCTSVSIQTILHFEHYACTSFRRTANTEKFRLENGHENLACTRVFRAVSSTEELVKKLRDDAHCSF